MKRMLASAFALGVGACHMPLADDVFNAGRLSIAACTKAYLQAAISPQSESLESVIDRAYVHDFPSSVAVLFSSGEVGRFGPRASDYMPLITCYLRKNDEVMVTYLAKAGESPIVGTNDDLLDIYSRTYETDAEATEMLFLLSSDGKFKFQEAQPLSDIIEGRAD